VRRHPACSGHRIDHLDLVTSTTVLTNCRARSGTVILQLRAATAQRAGKIIDNPILSSSPGLGDTPIQSCNRSQHATRRATVAMNITSSLENRLVRILLCCAHHRGRAADVKRWPVSSGGRCQAVAVSSGGRRRMSNIMPAGGSSMPNSAASCGHRPRSRERPTQRLRHRRAVEHDVIERRRVVVMDDSRRSTIRRRRWLSVQCFNVSASFSSRSVKCQFTTID